MEIRGIGLIDIPALFGVRAVRQQKRIDGSSAAGGLGEPPRMPTAPAWPARKPRSSM